MNLLKNQRATVADALAGGSLVPDNTAPHDEGPQAKNSVPIDIVDLMPPPFLPPLPPMPMQCHIFFIVSELDTVYHGL